MRWTDEKSDGGGDRPSSGKADAKPSTVTGHGGNTDRVMQNSAPPAQQRWDGYHWLGVLTTGAVVVGVLGVAALAWKIDNDRYRVSRELASGSLDQSAFIVGNLAKFNPDDRPYVTVNETCLHTMPRQRSMLPLCFVEGHPVTATPLTTELMETINKARAANIGSDSKGQPPWEGNPKDWVVVRVTYTAGEHTLLLPAKDVQPAPPPAASRPNTGLTQPAAARFAQQGPTRG